MFIKDLLFPKHCVLCGLLGSFICQHCQKQCVFVSKDTCFYCRKGSFLGLTHKKCKRSNGVDGFLNVFNYNHAMKQLIKKVKYEQAHEVLDEMFLVYGKNIIDQFIKIRLTERSFLISSLPLSKERLRQRGFNQAEKIAKKLAKWTDGNVGNFIERRVNTKPQASLKSRKDRYQNVRGSFVPISILRGKVCVLVDDVVTSGATAREAVKALKIGGAGNVYVFSLAKG